jgi:hypothetical protein
VDKATGAVRSIKRQPPFGAYRRAVRLTVEPGVASAAMEDDVHHFRVWVRHEAGVIRAVEAEAPRAPWATCPGAMAQLKALEGRSLEAVRRLPGSERSQQCLHLLDLALLAASRAEDAPFTRLYRVEAEFDGVRQAVRLWADGREALAWEVEGGVIFGSRFDGATLARLTDHLKTLSPDDAEAALVLRRGSMISMARTVDLDAVESQLALRDSNGGPVGATCFATQPQRLSEGRRNFGTTRDFSGEGRWPLESAPKEDAA